MYIHHVHDVLTGTYAYHTVEHGVRTTNENEERAAPLRYPQPYLHTGILSLIVLRLAKVNVIPLLRTS
jgi:hypothetical protein